MLNRIQVYNTVDNLPEQFPIDQLIDNLIFIEKVEAGIIQSKSGEVNTKEQTRQKYLN